MCVIPFAQVTNRVLPLDYLASLMVLSVLIVAERAVYTLGR